VLFHVFEEGKTVHTEIVTQELTSFGMIIIRLCSFLGVTDCSRYISCTSCQQNSFPHTTHCISITHVWHSYQSMCSQVTLPP